MTERIFALVRIASGDYLLPGNDERTLWRIAKYQDGESFGLDVSGDRWYWGVWLHDHPIRPEVLDPERVLAWEHWQMQASSCRTRAEAIAEVERMMR